MIFNYMAEMPACSGAGSVPLISRLLTGGKSFFVYIFEKEMIESINFYSTSR